MVSLLAPGIIPFLGMDPYDNDLIIIEVGRLNKRQPASGGGLDAEYADVAECPSFHHVGFFCPNGT
jgi:hypothetical protein